MPDHLTPDQRSKLMSRVRGRDTKPELLVRKLLHRLGYRFRIHQRSLPGTPDIVLKKHMVAIFVHGCFWHGHEGCQRSRLPQTRTAFWERKIRRNIERDSDASARLSDKGFRVLVLWECELKNGDALAERLVEQLPRTGMTNGAQIADERPGRAQDRA